MESDFSLSLILNLLKQRQFINKTNLQFNPTLKIILMSATIETNRFSEYVSCYLRCDDERKSQQSANKKNQQHLTHLTPILHIPGRVFSVEEYYYEDFRSFIYPNQILGEDTLNSMKEEVKISAEEKEKSLRLKKGIHKIPYDDMITLILKMQNNSTSNQFGSIQGAILVFLPGIAEIFRFINQFQYRLKTEVNNNPNQFLLLPLHSSLSNSEQKKVFLPAQSNVIKIVVSTNVAEASITIPDITIIIDSCLVKEMTVNPLSKVFH